MRSAPEPELLDELPASDPRAVRSRADLRRLNRIMGSAGILDRALRGNAPVPAAPTVPRRVVELGAGDGTLALVLARRWATAGVAASFSLVDRSPVVAPETTDGFAALGMSVETFACDAFEWLERPSDAIDWMYSNLFLHHFDDDQLRRLLGLAAERTDVFAACEPHRAQRSRLAARLVGLVGCNAVTRHDAVVSVRAGFVRGDFGALWPTTACWNTRDRAAGLFSRCFVARRDD